MSKLYETLQKIQKNPPDINGEPLDLLLKPKVSDKRDPWKKKHYPIFSDYNIEDLLDYFISLKNHESVSTVGVLPVSPSLDIPLIVLESFMHLSANCNYVTFLADRSIDRSMLNQLEASNAFDRSLVKSEKSGPEAVLNNLFHVLSMPAESSDGKTALELNHTELIKLTGQYELSLILLPTVDEFNADTVKLARQLNSVVLMSEENHKQQLTKVSAFLKRLKIDTPGVYLID